jgi:DNA-binding NtrC family response regulator
LQNTLSRAAILSRGTVIQIDNVQVGNHSADSAAAIPTTGSLSLKEILAETERRVIAQALEQEQWNRTRAAEVLGISRRQLFDKIQHYRLRK